MGGINSSQRSAGSEEELVPMINATNFDDEESEGKVQQHWVQKEYDN